MFVWQRHTMDYKREHDNHLISFMCSEYKSLETPGLNEGLMADKRLGAISKS